jgi:acyl-CoA thioesterase
MASRFATDTAVTRIGDGRYAARVDEGWWIVRGPNGGYIAAMILRAIVAEVNDPERAPRSLTIHYTRPPVEGPVDIEVTVERAGRTLSTLSARMLQEGKLTAVALAAAARDQPAFSFSDVIAPAVPAAEELNADTPLSGRPEIPMRQRYETRWAIGAPPGAVTPTDAVPAEVGGWIRLEDPEPVDHMVVAAITDAWLPAVFSRMPVAVAVPTVELTVHFREPPPCEPQWCLVRFRSRHAAHGYVEEEGEVWSEDGRLLAQSRQLALFLPMEGVE